MKKFKSIWMTFLIAVLSVAMVVGTLGITAFAAEVTISDGKLLSNITIVDKVEYGKTFDVPNGGLDSTQISVKAPNGETVELNFEGNKATVTAAQIGHYTVTYKAKTSNDNKAVSYDYTVASTVKNSYSVKVEFGGADIPTYIRTGDSFVLPKATLIYTDEEGEQQEAENYTMKVKIGADSAEIGSLDVETAFPGGRKYTAAASGNLYVQYIAQLSTGTKYYTKDFTVRVQDNFTDTKEPTLNVVNVATDANINKKVTLPVATASDDFDSTPKIDVEVTFEGEKVKQVNLDDNDFAISYKDEFVVFDNDKSMSFYPMEEGDYKVTYVATDDSGKKSGVHNYKITVSDKSAPVFKNIADDQIPENWGLSIKTGNANPTRTHKIAFPVPEMIDNAGAADVSVGFKITNSDNDKIIEFSNIFDAEEEYESDGKNFGADKTKYKFADFTTLDEEKGFDFTLVKKPASHTGSFTVEYRAKDKKGNVATKTYKINVEAERTFDKTPDMPELTLPKYISTGSIDNTFIVPSVEVADKNSPADARLKKDYTITSNTTEPIVITVKGGETAEIIEETGKYYLKIEDNKYELNTKLTFKVKVTNDAGLSSEFSQDVSIVSPNNAIFASQDLSLINSNLAFAGFKAGQTAKLGEFAVKADVTGDINLKYYTGFEVSIKDSDGNYLNGVSMKTYFDSETIYEVNKKGQIKVYDLAFKPSVGGDYQLSIRMFNLAGKQSVVTYPFNVSDSSSGDNETSSMSMPTEGVVNKTYSLKNPVIKNLPNDGTYFAVYEISGGRFSLMGTDFTALTQAKYYFKDNYAKYDSSSSSIGELNFKESYWIVISDEETPVIEGQGSMPLYWEKQTSENTPDAANAWGNLTDVQKQQVIANSGKLTVSDKTYVYDVQLPSVIAANSNGTARAKLTVKYNGTDPITPVFDEATNTYSFKPNSDGKYTLTYSAAVNGSDEVTSQFTINVGDVVPPKFTVNDAHAKRAAANSTFKYSAVTAAPDEGELTSDFTFTKKLLDPSGEEVSGSSISGKGSLYAGKKDNGSEIKLTKSGDYTVIYEVSDAVGNTSTIKYTITVNAASGGTSISMVALSTVLIIIGVILIVGVIVYFVRFRKVKEKKDKK